MTFQAISSLFPAILERAGEMMGIQHLLNSAATAEERKEMITRWWEEGHLSDEETQLLVEAYGLETA